MYWKLIAGVLISLILLVVCYLILDAQKYIKYLPGNVSAKIIQEPEHKPVGLSQGKFKIDFSKEEDFKNGFKKLKLQLKLTDDYVAYYFPIKCPDYRLEIYLLEVENGLEKYYVPEEGHLIVIKKDHVWTKEPDFLYWTEPGSVSQIV